MLSALNVIKKLLEARGSTWVHTPIHYGWYSQMIFFKFCFIMTFTCPGSSKRQKKNKETTVCEGGIPKRFFVNFRYDFGLPIVCSPWSGRILFDQTLVSCN